jgi:hypothetical protein
MGRVAKHLMTLHVRAGRVWNPIGITLRDKAPFRWCKLHNPRPPGSRRTPAQHSTQASPADLNSNGERSVRQTYPNWVVAPGGMPQTASSNLLQAASREACRRPRSRFPAGAERAGLKPLLSSKKSSGLAESV